MTGVLAIIATILLGWLAARFLAGESSLVTQIALGGLFGPGIVSIILFAMLAAGIERRFSLAMVLLALTGLTAWLAYRFRAMPSPSSGTSGGLNWLLGIAAAICLAAVISGFYATSTASPDGDWDAFAIWNVRAHYLAGGEATWHRALAPDLGAKMLGASHPGYPLLLSGFVGAVWILGGVTNSPAPVAASLLFSLVIVALLGGALFRARGLGLALLACIILLSSEVFAAQTAEQYSDLPLACCFLAALALLDHAQSEGSPGLFAAAGFAAGLAPWAKNEGWPFAIAFLFLVLWRCGAGKAKWALMGSLPGLLAALSVKLLVKVGEGMFPSTLSAAVSKIADPSRWSQTIAAFLQAIWRMGVPWAHPLLLIAAVGLVCGFIPGTQRLAKTWLLIPLAAVFAADFGIFLITTANLQWHLSTTVDRLVAQLWPAALFVACLMMQPAEEDSTVSPRRRASRGR